MSVGGFARSAVQNLGWLDLYENYLLHSGLKAEGNWQVHTLENEAQSTWPWGGLFCHLPGYRAPGSNKK